MGRVRSIHRLQRLHVVPRLSGTDRLRYIREDSIFSLALAAPSQQPMLLMPRMLLSFLLDLQAGISQSASSALRLMARAEIIDALTFTLQMLRALHVANPQGRSRLAV